MIDYEKIIREDSEAKSNQTAPEGDNPYLSLILQEKEQRITRARAVIERSLAEQPDIAAERQRLSNSTGLPLRVIERNLDIVRRKEQARAVNLVQLAQDSPVLARQLVDPSFTSTAVDDLGTLTKIEKAVGGAVRYMMGAGERNPVSDLGDAATTLGLGATVGVGKMAFDVAGVLNDALGLDSLAAGARSSAKRAQGAMDAYGFQGGSSTLDAVRSGLQSAGLNMALMPLGLVRNTYASATTAGSVVAGAMAAGVGADAYNRAREKGKGKIESAVFGVPMAAFEYVFERIPAIQLFGDIAANTGLIKTIGKQLAMEVPTEQLTTLAQDFTEWMNLNPEKTLGEFVMERPDAAYQTFIATLVGTGVQTSAIVGVNKAVEKLTNQRLQFDIDALNEQMKLAGQSALRERSPQQFRAHIQRVVDETDGANKTIFVDGDVLQQLPPDVLQQLPQDVQDQVEEAARTGGMIEIPLSDILTVAPGTPLEKVLNENARVNPDAPSQADLRAKSEESNVFLQGEIDKAIAQAEDQEAARVSVETVRENLTAQLVATGRHPTNVAGAMASWASAFYATMGARSGMTAEQFYERYPLRVLGEPSGAGQVLNASQPIGVDTPAFQTWFGEPGKDSTMVDGSGAPMVLYHGTTRGAKIEVFRRSQYGALGPAVYLGDSREASAGYDQGQMMKVYARGRYLTNRQWTEYVNKHGWSGAEKAATADGWSGVYDAMFENAVAVWNPSDIKSATGNDGTFDVNDPSILSQEARGTFTPSTPEQAADQTQTPEFNAWFDESKVVDADGKPLVVYHGTDKDFDAFNADNIGDNFGVDKEGFFFTGSTTRASGYADPKSEFAAAGMGVQKGDEPRAGANVVPVYLSIQKPLTLEAYTDAFYTNPAVEIDEQGVSLTDYFDDNRNSIMEFAKRGGHDGVVFRHKGKTLAVAFEPEQIKSAIGNDGTFDANDPSILSQEARGTFNPNTLELVLNPNADLTTWFHETGHFFLEVMSDMASQPSAPAEIADDMAKVLKWFGVADLATWRGMTLDEQRQYHERWAESVEQYVMEGKAPSKELAPVMRRFSAWLTSAYRSIKQFLSNKPGAAGMALNDDIRRVMDRMLATDEQIAEAEQIAGLVPDDTATADATNALRKRSMAMLKWSVAARDKVIAKLQKEAKEIRKDIIAQATVEIDETPEMRAQEALDALTVDVELEGRRSEWKAQRQAAEDAARAAIQEQMVAAEEAKTGEQLKGLPKGRFIQSTKREVNAKVEMAMIEWDRANPRPLRQANPDDADMATIADSFGYQTVEAMMEAIQAFGNRRDAIEGLAERRMLEEHGELIDERAIKAAANEAVHNQARAKALAAELRSQADMLARREDTGEVNAAGSKITVSVLMGAAQRFAANVVDRTPLRDIKGAVWRHTASERRAAREWAKATAAGKTQEAAQAKRDQLLHHTAVKELLAAQAKGVRIREFFARVVRGKDDKVVEKGRDADIVNAARAVLTAYGIQSPASKKAREYMEAVREYDPATYNAVMPMVEQATDNAQPVDALTFGELDMLHDSIQALWHLAKRNRTIEVAGDRMDLDDAGQELYLQLEANGIPVEAPGDSRALTKGEERKTRLQSAIAILSRVEQWVGRVDGKYGGPFQRILFQPIKDAADAYRAERIIYRRKFTKLVDNLMPEMQRGPIAAPELGYTFGEGHNGNGTSELMHAILHTGNASNKRKLLLGRGWATKNPDGTMDTTKWDAFINRMHDTGVLNRSHYNFAQGVWDLMEELKPGAQKAHRDAFGYFFEEVTSEAFDTPFGTYRGGYVPAMADARLVPEASQREMLEQEGANMAQAFPSTNKGFTKGRVEYNRKLVLDLRTLPQHMDKVLLFTHMENPARSAARLLRLPKVQQTLNLTNPAAISGMLRPWLNRAARQVVETPSVGDGGISRIASVWRARAGMSLMFGNISNTLQQITGIPSVLALVGAGHVRRSMALYIKNPKAFAAGVHAASPYMTDRASQEVAAMNGQVEALLIDPTIGERAQDWTMRHAYFMQVAADNVLAPVVWTAAYNQALTRNMGEVDAVKYADGIVRQTQTSSLPEDISRIESGPVYARIFTQFYNYFSMMANTNGTAISQIVREAGVRRGAGRIAYVVLMGALIPLWIAEGIATAMRGGPGDDDDDGYLDDWLLAVVGMGTVKGVLASVPVIGQFAVAGINRANNNPVDDRVSLSPLVSLAEAGVGAPVSVYDALVSDGSKRRAVRDLASLLSLLTGLPFIALARPLGYIAGLEDGQIKPTSDADLVRGLVTGSASKESRQ